VVLSAQGVPRDARRAGGETNVSSPVVEERRAKHRPTIMGRNMFGGTGPWGRRSVARLVGRGPALPPSGVRAHPPTRASRSKMKGGNHVPLRDRRDRAGRSRGPKTPPTAGHLACRRRVIGQPVPGRRPRRRDRHLDCAPLIMAHGASAHLLLFWIEQLLYRHGKDARDPKRQR